MKPKQQLSDERVSILVVSLSLLSLFLFSCIDEQAVPSLMIRSVQPNTLRAGGLMTVLGHGFGANGSAAISGRNLRIQTWDKSVITAQLPQDLVGGERYLVLTLSDERYSDPFPVLVENPNQRDRGPNQTYSAQDMGLSDMAIVDQMIGQTSDLGLTNQLEVILDEPEATVIMEAELKETPAGIELWLSFIARNPSMSNRGEGWSSTGLWGAAAHLNYPIDRLDFISMTAEPSAEMAALRGEISGRIFWYHGRLATDVESSRQSLMTLRFKILDPSDRSAMRFTLPNRFHSLRGQNNQRLNATWSSASIILGELL